MRLRILVVSSLNRDLVLEISDHGCKPGDFGCILFLGSHRLVSIGRGAFVVRHDWVGAKFGEWLAFGRFLDVFYV